MLVFRTKLTKSAKIGTQIDRLKPFWNWLASFFHRKWVFAIPFVGCFSLLPFLPQNIFGFCEKSPFGANLAKIGSQIGRVKPFWNKLTSSFFQNVDIYNVALRMLLLLAIPPREYITFVQMLFCAPFHTMIIATLPIKTEVAVVTFCGCDLWVMLFS